jgi:hypothetical protein
VSSAAAALGLLSAAVIVAHAALLQLGKWHPDEFFLLALLEWNGPAQVLGRMFGWSPRPVSELIIWAYSRLVAWRGDPSGTTCLAFLWLALLAALCGAARAARLGLALPLVLAAAALLVAKPGEMWFWPAGALAYLPAFGGIAVACLLALSPRPGTAHHLATCAALSVAAGSAEVGAVCVLLFAGFQASRRLAACVWPRWAPLEPAWSWLLPGLVAAGVVFVLWTNRAAGTSEIMGTSPAVHDLGASAATASSKFWRMLAGVPVAPHGEARIWFGLPLKAALFLGFRALLPPGVPTASRRLICLGFIVAMLGASFASMVFAYRQFGILCCERHETLRQALVVLAILMLAAIFPRPAPDRGLLAAGAGLSALAGAILVTSAIRLPAWRSDLALLGPTLAVRTANWASGRSPGDAMEYRPEPLTSLSNGWRLTPGTYRRATRDATVPPGMDLHVFVILLYFDKLEIRVH